MTTLRLSTLPLTPSDLVRCAPLWGGREGLAEEELQAAVAEAARLVESGQVMGRIFVDAAGEVRAFGCSTFVSDACAGDVLRQPRQLFGTRLLTDATLRQAVLDDAAVAKGNGGSGNALLVVSQGYRMPPGAHRAGEWETILGAMMQAFVDTHRGYNVSVVLNEVFGAEGMEAIEQAGRRDLDILARFDTHTPAGPLRSLIWTLDRASAQRRRSLLLPLFLYAAPLLKFSPTEQALLRRAMAGSTDRELSRQLGIPLTAVKGRWTRIQARVAEALPDLCPPGRATEASGTRGTQVRHHILNYLRLHPSEVNPYAAPAR